VLFLSNVPPDPQGETLGDRDAVVARDEQLLAHSVHGEPEIVHGSSQLMAISRIWRHLRLTLDADNKVLNDWSRVGVWIFPVKVSGQAGKLGVRLQGPDSKNGKIGRHFDDEAESFGARGREVGPMVEAIENKRIVIVWDVALVRVHHGPEARQQATPGAEKHLAIVDTKDILLLHRPSRSGSGTTQFANEWLPPSGGLIEEVVLLFYGVSNRRAVFQCDLDHDGNVGRMLLVHILNNNVAPTQAVPNRRYAQVSPWPHGLGRSAEDEPGACPPEKQLYRSLSGVPCPGTVQLDGEQRRRE